MRELAAAAFRFIMGHAMALGFTTFRAYDPGEALDAIRRRHPALIAIDPAGSKTWSYTASNLRLGELDIGRQTTTGFTGRTGRDDEGIRLIIVRQGGVVSRVGATERINDAAHGFGFIHPEGDGTFSAGYGSIALRLPFGRIRTALATFDCDLDPLNFVEENWAKSDLPGAARLQNILNALLLVCEEADALMRVDQFCSAQEQIVSLHLADFIAASQQRDLGCWAQDSTASIRACVDYIGANSTEQFDLAAMARYAGISLRTAQAQFARHLGTTISAYLRTHRLERVRARLSTEGDATVTNAAFDEGFTHLGEFGRWYVRRFGEKPSETLRAARMRRLF